MVLVIVKDILRALAHLHQQDLIHKYISLIDSDLSDIRAENIIVTKKGRNMLTGLRRVQSKLQGGKRVHNVFQELGANLEWQAPEVIKQVINACRH